MLTENLARYSYHTGAKPTQLQPDEACPPLFRDIGFEAMLQFLNGTLTRLCGPLSPITYLRTAAYREPYIDYGRTGRLLLLRPRETGIWHSGIESIYIAPRNVLIDADSMVFVPADVSLEVAARRFSTATTLDEFREEFGTPCYADAVADTRERLMNLQRTHHEVEQLAAPLRKLFQAMDGPQRDEAQRQMHRRGLTESDLCTAWHHLPDERREFIRDAFRCER